MEYTRFKSKLKAWILIQSFKRLSDLRRKEVWSAWQCVGFRFRMVLVVGKWAAGCRPCKKLQERFPGSKSALPLAKAEPICVCAINIFKRRNLFSKGLLSCEISSALEESRTERQPMKMTSLVGKKMRSHSGVAISLLSLVRWQAVCSPWRSPFCKTARPLLHQWRKVPKKGSDSEGEPLGRFVAGRTAA